MCVVIYEIFVLNNVNYFFNINVHSKMRQEMNRFHWNLTKLSLVDIGLSRVFIGIFKINVVVDHVVDLMAHFHTIPISIVMIMMNKLVFVQMVTSKFTLIIIDILFFIQSIAFLFPQDVYFYIEMQMIQKNVIIYVITKRAYVHMKQMLKDIV